MTIGSVWDVHSHCNLQTWKILINILEASVESLAKVIQYCWPINIFLLDNTLGCIPLSSRTINKQHWPCAGGRVTVYLSTSHHRCEASQSFLNET